MRKIAITIILSSLFAISAIAAPVNTEKSNKTGMNYSFGVNYSFDEVFGSQLEFDISKIANNAPVSVQLFVKNYSQRLNSNYAWNTTGIGAAAIYDLSSFTNLDKKFHPYAGLGLLSVAYTWAGFGPPQNYSGVSSGLYVTGGVKYTLTPQFDADLNYNDFGGLTVGMNFKF